MGKKVDHFLEVKRYPPNAGHRQGVGTVSKTATGKFDSYGLRKIINYEKEIRYALSLLT
jgi:hypothetical protein